MATVDPQSVVTVHVQTELQYDVDVQQPAFPSGSLSAIAITIAQNSNRFLNVYYINQGKIFNAYQNDTVVTTGSPVWVVSDTHFPNGVQATLLRASSLPNGTGDLLLVVTPKNDLYMMDTSNKYPSWVLLPSLPDTPIIDAQIVVDDSRELLFTVYADSKMWVSDPSSVFIDGWDQDLGLVPFTNTLKAFVLDDSLGKSTNKSTWGYLVASTAGLKSCTGGAFSSRQIPIITTIDKGSYTSICTASIPGTNPSLPLIFAVDPSLSAYYFQIGSDGTFTKVPILSGVKVAQLEAVVRYSPFVDTGETQLWAEVFARDPNGVIYHLESEKDLDTRQKKFVLLNSGNYAVQGWRSFIQIDDKSAAINSVSSPDGDAFLMSYSTSGGNTVNVLTQDGTTTDWTTDTITLPATKVESVVQSKVYYVEATIMDGNRMPVVGRATTINGTQYCQLDFNGRVVTVDPIRTASAVTNASGRVCFTLEAPDSLAIPTFSIWAEGMDIDTVIDISPNGSIQGTLANLTVESMREAKNLDDPNHPVLFPSTGPNRVSDDDLKAAADGIKQVINIVDPSFAVLNVPFDKVDHNSAARRYLHPRTHPAVARTRKRTARSLGHIRGRAKHGVHIRFEPKLHVSQISTEDAITFRTHVEGGLFDIPWGDLWRLVKKGAQKIYDVILEPIVDGIKATVTFFIDQVKYFANAVINFVQKAYDVISEIFVKIGAFFKDLFGWLAFLFDWDDFKRTANHFQSTINGFQKFGVDLLGTALPNITKGAFGNLKNWIQTNLPTVETSLQGMAVHTYDQDNLPPAASVAMAGDDSGLLANLPSSATWLMNKIFNSGTGTANQTLYNTSTALFDNIFSKFMQNVTDIGAREDLQNAYNSIGQMLTTFKDRGVFDSTSWVSLLDVAKNFLFVLLDIVELLVLTVEDLAAEAMKFFFDLLNMPLNIPIISAIFKKLTGVELTIINTVTFIIAIPFTILYKVIAGVAPFTSANALGEVETPADDLNLSKGIVMVLNGLWTSAVDLVQSELDQLDRFGDEMNVEPLERSTFVTKLINGVNIISPLIILGLGGYPSISTMSPATIAFWGIGVAPPVLTMIFWIGKWGGPAGNIKGQIALGCIGAGQLASAIYQTVIQSQKGWTPKSTAAIVSAWFLPWTNLFRWLRSVAKSLDPLSAQVVIISQLVINLVSGCGSGIALIVSSRLSSTTVTHATMYQALLDLEEYERKHYPQKHRKQIAAPRIQLLD